MKLKRLYVSVCAIAVTTLLSAGTVLAWGVADEVIIGDAPSTGAVSGTAENNSAEGTGADAAAADAAGTEAAAADAENAAPAATVKLRRDIEDGVYVLVSKLVPDMCMGIAGNSDEEGANVELVNGKDEIGQAFYVKKLEGTSRYTFVNYNSGLSIEWDTAVSEVDESGVPASFVTQGTYTGDKNQQWLLEEVADGYLQIRVCGKKMVLDVANGLTDEGTDIRVYETNQTDAQLWQLVKVG